MLDTASNRVYNNDRNRGKRWKKGEYKMSNQEKERGVIVRHDDDYFGLFHPLWDDFFNDRPYRKEVRDLQRVMRTDITEQDDGYEFKIEVPGYEKDELNIGLENGYLTIAANKTAKADNHGHGNYLRRERLTTACSRSFYVGDIDEKAITANLKHGVLTLFVPKENKPTKKHIEIK